MSYIIEYANKIESGEIVVCKKIKRLYCEILRPIVEGKSKEWYLDEKAGKGFIEFDEANAVPKIQIRGFVRHQEPGH
jgi:hypothetical protein